MRRQVCRYARCSGAPSASYHTHACQGCSHTSYTVACMQQWHACGGPLVEVCGAAARLNACRDSDAQASSRAAPGGAEAAAAPPAARKPPPLGLKEGLGSGHRQQDSPEGPPVPVRKLAPPSPSLLMTGEADTDLPYSHTSDGTALRRATGYTTEGSCTAVVAAP